MVVLTIKNGAPKAGHLFSAQQSLSIDNALTHHQERNSKIPIKTPDADATSGVFIGRLAQSSLSQRPRITSE